MKASVHKAVDTATSSAKLKPFFNSGALVSKKNEERNQKTIRRVSATGVTNKTLQTQQFV